jgi:hypothetical protein
MVISSLTAMPLDQPYPWYRFTMVLSQVTYTFEVYYNTRADRWRLNIMDVTGASLLMGVPLLIERDLTGNFKHLSIPPGLFLVIDGKTGHSQPGLSGFALNHVLYYLEVA